MINFLAGLVSMTNVLSVPGAIQLVSVDWNMFPFSCYLLLRSPACIPCSFCLQVSIKTILRFLSIPAFNFFFMYETKDLQKWPHIPPVTTTVQVVQILQNNLVSNAPLLSFVPLSLFQHMNTSIYIIKILFIIRF